MILSKTVSFKNLQALSPSVLLQGRTLKLLSYLLLLFCNKISDLVIFVICKIILKDSCKNTMER